MVMYCTHC